MKINIVPIAHDKGASLAVDVEEELSLLPPAEEAPGARSSPAAPSGPLSAPTSEETVLLVGPVRFQGEITNADKLFHLSGEADARVRGLCARCLQPVELHLTVPVLAEFRRLSPEFEAGRAPRGGQEWDDADVAVFRGDVVDFTEQVREEINLSLPYRILCCEDCAGLCPKCGANLNEGPCGCSTDEGDLRLAALAEWKRVAERGPDAQKS